MQSLRLAHKGQDYQQAAAEVSWPLLCVVRNATEDGGQARMWLYKEELQERDVPASSVFASNLAKK